MCMLGKLHLVRFIVPIYVFIQRHELHKSCDLFIVIFMSKISSAGLYFGVDALYKIGGEFGEGCDPHKLGFLIFLITAI